MKPRHFYKKDDDCPSNLLASRSSADPILKISGALCEAIQRNLQWVVDGALRQLTVEECETLLATRKAQIAKEQES